MQIKAIVHSKVQMKNS